MQPRHGRLRPLQRACHAGAGLLAVAWGFAACVDSGGAGSGILYPTLIAVSPADFLGPVLCANAKGALRRYVATLYDVTDDSSEGFALPSSGPVDCLLDTKFGFVVPGNRYVARVDGYDRTDIRPLGSGSPVMVDTATGEYVAPRWTSTCSGAPGDRPDAEPAPDADTGDTGTDADPDDGASDAAPDGTPDGSPDAEGLDAGAEAAAQVSCEADPDPIARRDRAVTCLRYLTRRVAACDPLCDRVGPGVTGLSVRIDRALGTLQCGNGPGQVATFRVEREGGTEPAQLANCGQDVIFTEGLTPRRSVNFRVTAFESANPSPSWETSCNGVPAAGSVLPVSCDLLVSTGAAPKTDF